MANEQRPARNGAELLIRALENEGVKYIFAVPGEENLAFLEALRTSSIELVLNRHEQAAGFMAATYGRLTGHVGVCLSTLGPGATNLVTAAAYVQLGGMPMMMISGQKPIKSSKQGLFQILDVVDLMRPLTKYTRQISNANTIPAEVREAFRLASEERPGAVHLELPEDIAAEAPATDTHIFAPSDARRPSASTKSLDMACGMLREARHPLIMIGAGANRKRVSQALLHLINVTGILRRWARVWLMSATLAIWVMRRCQPGILSIAPSIGLIWLLTLVTMWLRSRWKMRLPQAVCTWWRCRWITRKTGGFSTRNWQS